MGAMPTAPRNRTCPASSLPSSEECSVASTSPAATLSPTLACKTSPAAMLLGAGRAALADVIDPAAGLVLHAKVGDKVSAGDVLATLHSSEEDKLIAGQVRFLGAVGIAPMEVAKRRLVHGEGA